jgi:hypothetical protein
MTKASFLTMVTGFVDKYLEENPLKSLYLNITTKCMTFMPARGHFAYLCKTWTITF